MIDAIIGQVTPDLVILDSLSTLVRTGEENSPEHWMPVQNWLMSHRWRGRSMLIIHHAGKSGAQRGTSKREDTPETTLQLVKRQRGEGDNGDESVFEMTFTKGREVFGGQEEPLVLRLAIREGRVHWSHETMRDEKKERVREMLKLGLKHAEIAQELGISRSRVTQISSEIRNGGQVLPFLRRDR